MFMLQILFIVFRYLLLLNYYLMCFVKGQFQLEKVVLYCGIFGFVFYWYVLQVLIIIVVVVLVCLLIEECGLGREKNNGCLKD